MKALFSILLGFFAISISSTQSSAAESCSEFHHYWGAFHHQRLQAADGECFLTADPSDVPSNFKYRSYLITDRGLLMIFNSYSPSGSASATGARVFYFFPRKITPNVKSYNGQTTMLLSAPGIELNLSQDQTKILTMKGAVIKEDPNVRPDNQGGVEISKVKTLLLDAGFNQGSDPTGNPNRSSKFIDHKGHTCQVKNNEIFNLTSDGDANFKFSDSQLKSFLKTRCPEIQTNF
ncbi:MAG: hypothetical protein ACAH59_10195 [Pseudobdellovibrionaceae bacterium]